MSPSSLPFSPIYAAQPEEQSGISKGDTGTDEPSKQVWIDAKKRMEAVTYETIETAVRIDPLAPFILRLQSYILFGQYDLNITDDDKEGTRKKEMDTWIEQDIHLLERARQLSERARIHGTAHLQKLYADSNKIHLKTDTDKIHYLQLLKKLEKHQDPSDDTNFFYYQKLIIPKNWQDPENEDTIWQKVWYTKKEEREQYPIKSEDKWANVDTIIELRNNEAGRSSIETCLNAIYIKNQIIMGMPMIVKIVTTPDGIFTFDLVLMDPTTKEVIWRAPLPPDPALNETDPGAYSAQKTAYDDFSSSMQTSMNTFSKRRLGGDAAALPATIKYKIVESSQSLNPAMLSTMFDILNKTIAWALGFPIALIDASGSELATSRTIMDTITPYLRGVQTQVKAIAISLLKEQFPDVKFTFAFSELHPRDAKDIAQVTKTHMESLKIGRDIGYSDADIRNTAAAFNLTEDMQLELGGAGSILKAEAIQAAIAEGDVLYEE